MMGDAREFMGGITFGAVGQMEVKFFQLPMGQFAADLIVHHKNGDNHYVHTFKTGYSSPGTAKLELIRQILSHIRKAIP